MIVLQRLEGIYSGKKTKYLQQKIKIIYNLIKKTQNIFFQNFQYFCILVFIYFQIKQIRKNPGSDRY